MIAKRIEEILLEVYNEGTADKFPYNKLIKEATQAILKVIEETLPKEKTNQDMLSCLGKAGDSLDALIAKKDLINQIIGYNQCLSDIKSKLGGEK